MKTTIFSIILLGQCCAVSAQDSLWVRYDNRFQKNVGVPLTNADSIRVKTTQAVVYYSNNTTRTLTATPGKTTMMFDNPGRYLLKPSTYSGTNYENQDATSGYNFAHSKESTHFVVFWDVRYGSNPNKIQYPGDGNVTSADYVLNIAEKCWDMYAGELGFVKEGSSTTDKYKVQLYIPYQKEWRADASGTNGQEANGTWSFTGLGHFNPWAANARGGHTIAHEVGHTFQYLVSADLGSDASGHYDRGWRWGWGGGNDNSWWESCADWQAYQIFPDRQFTDGEYFEQHLDAHHLNLLHEDWRYACCYIHDWWAMLHGRSFIGQMWRETKQYEDPIQTYMRMNSLNQEQFNDELMQGYMHMATWDIDGVRDRAKHRIGQHKNRLKVLNAANATYTTDPETCIQNYGYHITNMQRPAIGTTVKANFKGLTDASGYHYVYPARAGWRYAFVAYSSDGTRTYGEVKADKEGTAELTIPEGCTRLFFVVMGAPTQHWPHPWTSGKSSSDWSQNNEQWPYQVQFENTKPL
jgi:hypothetical protein